MRLTAFITEGAQSKRILQHIGVNSEPPHVDGCGDAQMGDGVEAEPDWATDWDGAAQPAPDFDVGQRVNG